MTFRQLAINNVKGSWHRYSAYFLSCTFSVLVFYLFASFIAHPVVLSGHIVGGGRQGVTAGLYAAEVIILIFSFLFILYSTSAFLRSRKKEFGLLTLMGMTQGQLRRMLLAENIVIAGLAMLGGLTAGIVFSKLFFMAMTVLMHLANPIYFIVPLKAVGLTVLVFSGMFLALTWFSLLGVRQSSVRELLKAHRQARPVPRFRMSLLVLGLALLIAGYILAWQTDGSHFIVLMFPIIGLVIAGTYLVVLHGGVAVCRWLQSRRSTIWRGTNVVTVNRVVFRLRDNARIIFVTAILIAVVCSALGAFNTLLQNARDMAMDSSPYAVSFELSGAHSEVANVAARIQQELQLKINKPVASLEVVTFRGNFESPSLTHTLSVISFRAFQQASAVMTGLPDLSISPGEAAILQPYRIVDANFDSRAPAKIAVADRTVKLQSVQLVTRDLMFARGVLVVSDEDFDYLAQAVAPTERTHFFGFEFANWEDSWDVGQLVQQSVGSDAELLHARVDLYVESRQMGALTMFIGVFVSFLFFVASGSLLYFKLFTEAEDDRQQFNILRDLGMTRREMMRVVNQEIGTIFFLPVLIGALHAAFALKTLSNLVALNIFAAGLMVAGTYLVLQIGYFLLVRTAYLKQMLRF